MKGNDWLLVDTCPQAANHCTFFFEFENELKFYNLEAWYLLICPRESRAVSVCDTKLSVTNFSETCNKEDNDVMFLYP